MKTPTVSGYYWIYTDYSTSKICKAWLDLEPNCSHAPYPVRLINRSGLLYTREVTFIRPIKPEDIETDILTENEIEAFTGI